MLTPDNLVAVATFDAAVAGAEAIEEEAGVVWAAAVEPRKTSASTDRIGVTESLGMGKRGLQFF
jgi:hypothetical protein